MDRVIQAELNKLKELIIHAVPVEETRSGFMAKQTNTPKEWRILAERDLAVADHLAGTMSPFPTTGINV